MRHRFTQHRKFALLFGSLLLITGYLSGCGDKPVKKEAPVTVPDSHPLLTTGPAQLPRSQFSPQFDSAEQYLLAFDWMAASHVLESIPPEQASSTDLQYLNYLQARIHYLRGDQDEARRLLEYLRRYSPDPAIASKIDNFHRYLISLSGQALESARLGVHMLGQSTSGQPTASALERSIWRDLQRVPAEELQLALDSSANSYWQGWLSLSLLTADAGNELELQQGLARWRSIYPTHTDANALPGGLGYLLDRPVALRKVTLMLPLSGRLAPAAKSVRDGYLANFYAARLAGAPAYELQVLDLDRYSSVVQAYEEAVAAGTDLVVGPLSKHGVSALAGHPNRPVPVLALNQVNEKLPAGNTALVQLALAPEDEAEQIAQIAFGQGARRALVIRPAGNWGAKMEQALLKRWTALGGELAAVASYSSQEDYSTSMAAGLSLPQSEQRAREVRSMLATNIEFTARRRQDLDVIFLLGRNGSEARSLKPLLAYHYAGDLPVYATSSIYRGIPDARDKDLNGIRLVEIPWLLGGNPPLHAALAAAETGPDNYTRLSALGADAYLLQSRFNQLQGGPDVQIRGNTGLLSLDPQLRIQRELQAATFGGGVLNPL